MQQWCATASKRIGLDKLILQHTATRGNRCRRIVAPEGAGSSPVGHPNSCRHIAVRAIGISLSLFPRRPIVSGAGPHLALWWYGFAFECLLWGVDGKLANLFQAPCVLLLGGHEVVPGLDFCEGAFGPGLDHVA